MTFRSPVSEFFATDGVLARTLSGFAPRESQRLMAAIDAINRTHGRDAVRTAACGIQQQWSMRCANRSPRYTTRWDELPEVS